MMVLCFFKKKHVDISCIQENCQFSICIYIIYNQRVNWILITYKYIYQSSFYHLIYSSYYSTYNFISHLHPFNTPSLFTWSAFSCILSNIQLLFPKELTMKHLIERRRPIEFIFLALSMGLIFVWQFIPSSCLLYI